MRHLIVTRRYKRRDTALLESRRECANRDAARHVATKKRGYSLIDVFLTKPLQSRPSLAIT